MRWLHQGISLLHTSFCGLYISSIKWEGNWVTGGKLSLCILPSSYNLSSSSHSSNPWGIWNCIYFGGPDTFRQHSQFILLYGSKPTSWWCRSESQDPAPELAHLHRSMVEPGKCSTRWPVGCPQDIWGRHPRRLGLWGRGPSSWMSSKLLCVDTRLGHYCLEPRRRVAIKRGFLLPSPCLKSFDLLS